LPGQPCALGVLQKLLAELPKLGEKLKQIPPETK
jgi:hypothetical protein